MAQASLICHLSGNSKLSQFRISALGGFEEKKKIKKPN